MPSASTPPSSSSSGAGPGGNLPRLDGEEILAGIMEWVRIESPSHDAAAVNRMADHVEAAAR